MKKRIVSVLLLFGAASASVPVVRAAPVDSTTEGVSPTRPVTWPAWVAGPKRADIDRALEKPLDYPWHMFDRKTEKRHEANTCRELLALDATSTPMDVSDDGSPPTRLISNDWTIYDRYIVGCRAVVAIQNAKPARVDYLGAFPLDNARLKEIPAAVIPTPSDDEEKRLKKASARGVSWKGWDRQIHVTKSNAGSVTIESPDTYCSLSIYGRGDFNGDGIEDLVLWRSGGGQEGTWSSTAAFILTRRTPRGRIEIVKVIE